MAAENKQPLLSRRERPGPGVLITVTKGYNGCTGAGAPKGFSRGEAVSLWLTDEERRNVATGRHLRKSGRGFPRLRNCIPTWKRSPALICPRARTGAPSPRGKAWALPRQCNHCNQFVTAINTPGQDCSLRRILGNCPARLRTDRRLNNGTTDSPPCQYLPLFCRYPSF